MLLTAVGLSINVVSGELERVAVKPVTSAPPAVVTPTLGQTDAQPASLATPDAAEPGTPEAPSLAANFPAPAAWALPAVLASELTAEDFQLRQPLQGPIVDAAALLRCNRAVAWADAGVNWVLLERDVRVSVGVFAFDADRALVRIEKKNLAGRIVRDLAFYLDNVRSVPDPRSSPIRADAPRLLVTVSTTGPLELKTDLMREGRPNNDPFVDQGEARAAEHLALLARATVAIPDSEGPLTAEQLAIREARQRDIAAQFEPREAPRAADSLAPSKPVTPVAPPTADSPAPTTPLTPVAQPTPDSPAPDSPAPTTPVTPVAQPTADSPALMSTTDSSDEILPSTGVVHFIADRYVIQGGKKHGDDQGQTPEPGAILLMGKVSVMYQSLQGDRVVTLRADNAVIFLTHGSLADLASQRADASSVTGVYLEDNVIASDGNYTVRAPRVYYDVRDNRALLLEAVMYAWDFDRQVPLYLRADRLRQESATQWSGREVLITTSDFAKPHVALAARSVTFEQVRRDGRAVEHRYVARDTGIRWGDLPLFVWPKLSGRAEQTPLRDLRVGFSGDNGVLVRTRWDLFALAGKPRPEGVELLGELAFLGEHGPAAGLELDYARPDFFGQLRAYLLGYDTGEDEIGDRTDLEFDGDQRGYARWRHRHNLGENWELSLQLAYVSDETFLEEFFSEEASQAQQYETSIYLKKQEEDWALTFLASYDLNDFVTQTTTLQAPGYTVDKLPELGYYRVATPLLENLLTYYLELRAGGLRVRPGEDSPRERGFTSTQSALLFGIPATDRFETRFTGVPDDYVARFDTRHELQAPMKVGAVDLVPYVAGRLTAYDQDFEEFAGNDEPVRVMGIVGARVSTQFNASDDAVQSDLFDLHRLRHIVEPSADLFFIGSSVNPEEIPEFDRDVEGLVEGAGLRLGVTQTFQTQRGGEGQWRSVDWVVLRNEVILRSDDADIATILPRYISYRPEYSRGGDQFRSEIMWMVTDALAMTGEVIRSLEDDEVEQWRLGLAMDHTPRLRSFVEYVELDAIQSRLLHYGFTYVLTTKYTFQWAHSFDVDEGSSRGFTATLERRLPQWRLRVFFEGNEVEDDYTVGLELIPEGLGGRSPLAPPMSAWYR